MEFTPETFAQIGIQANDLDGINAAIKALNLMKKEGKEAFAAQAKAAKKVADAEAFAHGQELLANAKVGDIATVICGSGKFAKQFKFAIQKIGEKTITVEYTEGNTPNGTVGPRYPSLAKVIAVEPAA
jgi:hypothetical protein